MASLQYFDYEGFGDRSKRDLNYSQAVRIGDRIEVSGQGGWDRLTEEFPEDLGAELDQAFDNIEHAIQQAGGKGLEQVYKLRIYITEPLENYLEHFVRVLKGREAFKNHGPLATVVQVKGLYLTSRVEVEAEAYLGN